MSHARSELPQSTVGIANPSLLGLNTLMGMGASRQMEPAKKMNDPESQNAAEEQSDR